MQPGRSRDSGRGKRGRSSQAVPQSSPDPEQERPDLATAATGTPGFELGDEAGEPGAPDPGECSSRPPLSTFSLWFSRIGFQGSLM